MFRAEKGQATVEMAFALIILCMLVFGMIDFGRILHAYITLDHAGREAGRMLSLNAAKPDLDVAKLEEMVIDRIVDTANSLDETILKEPNNIKVNKEDSATSIKVSGSHPEIVIKYPVEILTPGINTFFSGSKFEINVKTVMRVE